MGLQRIAALARVETLCLLHDRRSLALIVSVPAIQVALFGGAIEFNPTHVPVAIAGDATSGTARRLVDETHRFQVVADRLPPGQAEARLRSGGALVAIEVPPPPSEAEPDAPRRAARILADGANPQEAGPALAALEGHALRDRIASLDVTGQAPPDVTWLYNPDRSTSWTLMPALAGVIVMISTLLLGALTLVREREQGRWESLLASPATAPDLVAGKLLPYLAIAPVQASIVLAVAHWGFGVPLAGSVAALIAAVPLFALAHLLLGFAISAAAQTQVQAIQLAVFFYLPCMLLSGFMFPFAAMPGWAQAVGAALPLTHFVTAARDVLLKGAGAAEVAMAMLPVAGFALGAGILAVTLCARRLD